MDNDTLGIIVMSGFALAFFGIPGFVGYRVARERGRNPFLWCIFSAFCPPFPIIVLYMIRPLKVVPGKTIRCPFCQEITFAKINECEVCGEKLHLPEDHPLMVQAQAKALAQN